MKHLNIVTRTHSYLEKLMLLKFECTNFKSSDPTTRIKIMELFCPFPYFNVRGKKLSTEIYVTSDHRL